MIGLSQIASMQPERLVQSLFRSGALSRAVSPLRPKQTLAVPGLSGGAVCEPKTPAAAYCATSAINLLALALPLSILQVYDRVIPNQARETLFFLFAGVLCALALDLALKIGRSALLAWVANHFVCRLSNEAIMRVLNAPDETADRHTSAVYANRYAAIAALGEYHAGASKLSSIDLPFAAIAFTVMMVVGGPMVLVPVVLFGFFGAMAVRRNRQFRDVISQRSSQDNKKYDFVDEALTGILTVKGMAMEPQMQRRFERLQQAVAEITSKSIQIGQEAQNAAVLYGSLSQVVVIAVGAHRVIDDQLSIGALACCTMLSGQILQPLLRAISTWMESESADHRRAEITALLDLPIRSNSGADAITDGSIRFEGVTFAYPGRPNPVLQDVSFEIPNGSIVGLKGEDGSGRSTLVKILRGDIKPASGRVIVGGMASSEGTATSLRRAVAYVGPSPVVFRGTILENLTLFRSDRTALARVMSDLIGLDSAINLLPEGFDTRLGEGIADDLPVSVAQQVCIARALTTDPAILVLDEANTALDRASEAALVKAIETLRGRKTILIATHRPSLLALSDRPLTFSNGRVEASTRDPGRAAERVAG